jgi:hypothetical protein
MPDPAAEIKARLRIVYHPAQVEIFDHPARIKIIVKGRRFGLTMGYANYCIERMLDGVSPILWVDTVNSNIDRYVERYFYPTLRQIPSQYWTWRQQKKELEVFGAKIDFRSADQPERIEGFGYRLVILNEAGIILNDPYLWENAILPMTIDYKPNILVGGTPKGKNLFFQLASKAQDTQEPLYRDWHYFHFTSYDNPLILGGRATIDALANDMPEAVRDQEIFAKFPDDGNGVFRYVDRVLLSHASPPLPGRAYCAGLDLGRKVDFTVLTIFDDLGNQVYFNRINKLDWSYQIQVVADTVKQYGAKMLVDSTGLGDPIFEQFRNAGVDVDGYQFTSASKKRLIESLMLAIEQQGVKLLDEPVQANELKMYTYTYSPSGVISYNAPTGQHDDCVISLALANWARQSITAGMWQISVF